MSESEAPSTESRVRQLLPDAGDLHKRARGILPRMEARGRLLRQKLRGVDLPSATTALEEIDQEYVREGATAVTDTDVETVVEEADAIEERFRENGPLRRLVDDGRLLLELVQDVRNGRYQHVPVWTLSAAAFALLYVLNPLDAIPDALPVVGVLDDAAVVSACLALLEQDLYDYRSWRRQRIGEASDSGDPPENSPTGEKT